MSDFYEVTSNNDKYKTMREKASSIIKKTTSADIDTWLKHDSELIALEEAMLASSKTIVSSDNDEVLSRAGTMGGTS
ncbi:MAG: hypothetical protein GY862_13160 [Gammaproteobacteria bacterium]|nr:hypothetical protein [Gammaproteobacteria bacterium]